MQYTFTLVCTVDLLLGAVIQLFDCGTETVKVSGMELCSGTSE